ncbi:MAG: bacillithiol biosynthesis cysteine-adding enzyme BshC [Chitinophagales bacterium]|nr:bacillithiol biosynthesis cysteine-adding enzyme BshC [Chitinophagales bacterium]
MKIHAIEYSQLNIFPKLIQDYLTNSETVKPFYNYSFNFQSFKQGIADRKFPIESRKVLVEVLTRQYRGLATAPIVSENIKKFGEPNTFAITTAHQPVLFTGPLYFIYKIISAINVAEQLRKEFPENHFVPVYFMGAEDHDFDEINHLWLNGEKIEWQHDRRGAVGRISTHDIAPLIQEVENGLQGEFAAEAVQLIKDAYIGRTTLAEATAYFVNSLFGEYGLVVINPDDKELKKLFAPVIEDELLNNRAFTLTEKLIKKITEQGYEIQANPREINLFYVTDGSRERIVFEEKENRYHVLNTALTFTRDEIIKEVQEHPEHFSPNVFLRPLFQEMMLPNLAYIGGAGELSYWFEQKAIFDYFNVNFPMLVLRNSAMLVDANTQKKFEKTGLDWNDFYQDEETLIKNFVKKNSTNTLDFSAEKDKINALFNGIRDKAAAVDVTLTGAVEAQKTAVINSIEGLEKKILKAEKRNFETSTAQIKSVKAKLFPNNNLQERVENFLPYYAAGGKKFIESLKKEFNPFNKQLLFFSE